ncbi:uncharacterized protein [Cicer arietinum]|uniref:uncharacterized protein n=1 Tax=Cicer arietinum TaxID=3827 RepID=UPI003CC68947
MDHKVIMFMMNVITYKEFDKCTNKEIAKSIYDALVQTNEGSKQIQKAKANILVKKYELIKMEENEDFKTMFSRFQTQVSGLKVFQKRYIIVDHVKKILRICPLSRDPRS